MKFSLYKSLSAQIHIHIHITYVRICVYLYRRERTFLCKKFKKKKKKWSQKENRRRPWPFFSSSFFSFVFFSLYFGVFSYCFSVRNYICLFDCLCCSCKYMNVGVTHVYVYVCVSMYDDLSGCDCNFMRIITPGNIRRYLRKTQTTWQPSQVS